jgi:sortase B
MLISSYFILKNKKEDKEQEEIFDEISEIAKENNNEDNNEKQVKINMQELYELNNDIVGWIKIDDTNIDYPVMQTQNSPNYYLRRNFYKQYSQWGTPYLSESCDINLSDNLIVYGHHINNSKMFGELENYRKEEFYKKHKFIKLYTLTEQVEYEIIAIFKTVADTGFRYYDFTSFEDEENFNAFVSECQKLSFYKIEKNIQYGDKFITLSTCDYTSQNGRLVVVARKIL